MAKENYVILWPSYFDSRCSRSEGRMVEKKYAIENPTPEEILKAVEILGYVKKIEDGAFPRYWWDRKGKIVVERKSRKSDIVRRVGQRLKENRTKAQPQSQQPKQEEK